ncbi:MAG: hypothetical protein OHK93_004494 [Ramalina farinacea]|uniref:Uncharacterized protein n=1 Tax=Ramalina farinacea TaxID=258253 RepID=A0AA43QUV8_9LECA|nr:hypothetical protein [Ramalina farinacea]
MSSHEDILSAQASDTLQEPPHEGSCTTTPVIGILVHFEGDNLRPRPRESAADWINRTRDHRQKVDAERERERRDGDPEKAQADWLKRWGFKSSEEADEIVGLSMFERYAAFQRCHRKRAADDSEEPEAPNIQPPFKKRKTVRFAEEHRFRLMSPIEKPKDGCLPSSTNGLEMEKVEEIRRAQKARREAKHTRDIERAKKWLFLKAYETDALKRDPRKVTLKQMREDNPSVHTFDARWWARKHFRDSARNPPLTPREQAWPVEVPSHIGEEDDDEDVYDSRREGDHDTDGLWDDEGDHEPGGLWDDERDHDTDGLWDDERDHDTDGLWGDERDHDTNGLWGDESPGRIISPIWGLGAKTPAYRSESSEGGPSQSPSNETKADEVVEQPRQRLLSSGDLSEKRAAEEILAKRWLAQKAFEISPLDPDPSLVTVKHMREGDPSEHTFQNRWLMHKSMMDDTREPSLTAQERNYCLNIPPLVDRPLRFEDYADLDIIDLDNTPEERVSELLGPLQNVTGKRPASAMDESEESPSHSSVKRPRIEVGPQRERPVGWLLDSLGGQRRARRWLAEKAARTSPEHMELTHKNTRLLSMEQMHEDYPSEITLWTRWATQKVMLDEMEEASQEQPGAAREQNPSCIEPEHFPDKYNAPPAISSTNRDTMTDSANPEPSVPNFPPNLVTQADSTAKLNAQAEPTPDLNAQAEPTPDLNARNEPTPKPDPFEAIMKRLDDLERIVQETRAGPASQQASSTATNQRRSQGRPEKSDIFQTNDGERRSITLDEHSETASEQNTATREKRVRPRQREQPKAEPNGKGKASGGLEPTTLPSQEQEPRPMLGRPRKHAQAAAKKAGSTSKPTTKTAAPQTTPASTPRQQRRRGRPRKKEVPVKSEVSTNTIGQETSNAQKATTAAVPSTHKMRTRTHSPVDQ